MTNQARRPWRRANGPPYCHQDGGSEPSFVANQAPRMRRGRIASDDASDPTPAASCTTSGICPWRHVSAIYGKNAKGKTPQRSSNGTKRTGREAERSGGTFRPGVMTASLPDMSCVADGFCHRPAARMLAIARPSWRPATVHRHVCPLVIRIYLPTCTKHNWKVGAALVLLTLCSPLLSGQQRLSGWQRVEIQVSQARCCKPGIIHRLHTSTRTYRPLQAALPPMRLGVACAR